jgi:hypothetical protein
MQEYTGKVKREKIKRQSQKERGREKDRKME